MGKSFQFNNRKETEKTEDVINTLVTGTAPLVSTYDDANNTLTLSVNTGKEATKLLKVGSANITAGQFIQMEDDGEVVGVSSGVASGNLLKVKDDVSLTNGQFVKIDDNGKIISEVPPDTQPLTTDQVKTKMNTIIKVDSGDTLIYRGTDETIKLGASKITIDETLEVENIIQSKVEGSTTSNLILRRGGGTSTQMTFGVDKTTTSQDFHIGTGYNTLNDSERTDLVVCGNTYIKGGTTIGGGSNDDTTQANLVVHYKDINSGADRGDTTNTGTKRYMIHNQGGVNDAGSGAWQDYGIFSHGPILCKDFIVAQSGTPVASDDRLKTEEVDITKATETLMLLRPKNYYKHPNFIVDKDDESPIPTHDLSGNVIGKFWESGLIAQSVEQIDELKHMVGNIKIEGNEIKVLRYEGLIPYLIKSIQELNQRIVELEQKNNV